MTKVPTHYHMGAPVFGGFAEVKIEGRRYLIEVSSETPTRVSGFRVNKDGSRWFSTRKEIVEGMGPDPITVESEHLIIASPRNITRRLQLNTLYCELEPAKED